MEKKNEDRKRVAIIGQTSKLCKVVLAPSRRGKGVHWGGRNLVPRGLYQSHVSRKLYGLEVVGVLWRLGEMDSAFQLFELPEAFSLKKRMVYLLAWKLGELDSAFQELELLEMVFKNRMT